VGYNMNSVRGHYGELTAAFRLGEFGIIFFKAPTEFDVNKPGTDLVGYDPGTRRMFIIDNKSYKAKMLDDVSSLMRNLPKNMTDDVAEFRNQLKKNYSGDVDPGVEAAVRRAEIASKQINDMLAGISTNERVIKYLLDRNVTVRLADGRRMPIQNAVNEILQAN